MPRFFVEHADEHEIIITGEDANHIGRALRMRTGEELTVCAQGMDYQCEITRITDSEVYLRPHTITPCAAEPSVHVTLYQALPKQDKLAEIVQKAVELGACTIVPVLTSRCVVRATKADFEKNVKDSRKLPFLRQNNPVAAAFRRLLPCSAGRKPCRRCSSRTLPSCSMKKRAV